MDEIILTAEDNNSELDIDVGDIINIILPENPGTGYTWNIDSELSSELEMIVSDYKMTYKKSLGGSGKRVIQFKARELGIVNLKLKYWQEWNGDDSIEKRFNVRFIIE